MARHDKPGRPKGRKPAYTVYARIDPAVGKSLDVFIEQTEPRTSQTAVVELALKRFLQTEGLPPTPKETAAAPTREGRSAHSGRVAAAAAAGAASPTS